MITGVAVAVVAMALGGGAWGVAEYRERQVTNEARESVEAVTQARDAVAAAEKEYEATRLLASDVLETLQPATDLTGRNPDFFDGEARGALGDMILRLDELTAEPVAIDVEMEKPFDRKDAEAAFIEQYRAANEEGRKELAATAAELTGQLDEMTESVTASGEELVVARVEAQRSAITMAQSIAADAETVISAHPEAGADTTEAIRRSAATEEWDEVADDQLDERVAEVPSLLRAYVDAAADVRDSHVAAVAAREEAARQAAAAAQQPSGGGGSGGGGGGSSAGGGSGGGRPQQLCNRFQPDITGGGGSLVLVPC